MDVSPEIDGKLRQFKRVLMSYVDFQQATGIASHILEMDLHARYPKDRFLLQGLNAGMIVAYCRPFSGNDRKAEVRVPDLPARILDVLTSDEMHVHGVVINDRNTVLAHSDSTAWEPQPEIHRTGGRDRLVPMFNYAHAPLTRNATETLHDMSDKLVEACFAERERLEAELTPYLPVVEVDEEAMREWAAESGLSWPPKVE